MNIDENDLLYTNTYIPKPDLGTDIPKEYNDEFRKYYKQEMDEMEDKRLRESIEKMSLGSLQLDEDTDTNSLLNTNRFSIVDLNTGNGSGVLGSNDYTDSEGGIIRNGGGKGGTASGSAVGGKGGSQLKRYQKEIKTYVSIDSRDRNRVDYSKPNFFKIFLGKTFYNVKTIRLASIEFPNTNAVINSKNNRIYWRNGEDIEDNIIDDVTKTYPVYSVELRIGSYISTTLKTEMTNKLSSVKRRNKVGDYHYFITDLDLDTDIVSFTSLILQQLENNPLSVTIGLGIVSVTAPSHGFVTGDTVYIVGAKTLAGIPADTLNNAHKITRINDNVFQYEINIKAAETVIGGGNTVKVGEAAPFQLLFGEYSNTVAQNIGFPQENSSMRIDTYIKSIDNIYQVRVVTTTPHNFARTYDYIGQTCTISGVSISGVNGTRTITGIVDANTLLIQVNAKLDSSTVNNGQLTFNGTTYDIALLRNNDNNTVLVTTFTDHNYILADIGHKITFYDTTSIPDFNTTNTITGLLSNTQIIIPGSVLAGGSMDVSIVGTGGSIPRHAPLTTNILQITNVTPGVFTKFTSAGHNLHVGDRIRLYNIVTNPPILEGTSGIYSIYSVPDNDTFTVDFTTVTIDQVNISNGTAYAGSPIINISVPYHGFNKITGISNGYSDRTIISITDVSVGLDYKVRITTATPHALATGDIVQIRGTNSIPNVNGSGYTVTYISDDTFDIPFTGNLVTDGSAGYVNMDPRTLVITTQLAHGFTTGDTVRLMQTNSVPSIDDGGYEVTVLTPFSFSIVYSAGIVTDGTEGIIGMNQEFYLYGGEKVGGITPDIINGNLYTVRDIIDEHNFTFVSNGFSTGVERGGGSNLYISSLFHGFNGVQKNTKNSLLNRSINLEGENYSFLCCPQLATMMNTGSVRNIFARITLDQSPGSVVFSFLSNPKEFDVVPLDKLSELEFSVVNYDGTLYDFNDLDYSFVLEITEVVDTTENFNFSSRRGTH